MGFALNLVSWVICYFAFRQTESATLAGVLLLLSVFLMLCGYWNLVNEIGSGVQHSANFGG